MVNKPTLAASVQRVSSAGMRLAGKTIISRCIQSLDLCDYVEGDLNTHAVLAGRLARRFNLVQSG
jgi:hypothetical protein